MHSTLPESEYCLLSFWKKKSIDFYFAAPKVSVKNKLGGSYHLRSTGLPLGLFIEGKMHTNEVSDLLWPCMYKYSNVSTLRCLKFEVLGHFRSCSVSLAFSWSFGISHFNCNRQDMRSLGGRKHVMGLIVADDGAFKLILSQWMT